MILVTAIPVLLAQRLVRDAGLVRGAGAAAH
jgi:hypothetical protein